MEQAAWDWWREGGWQRMSWPETLDLLQRLSSTTVASASDGQTDSA